MSDLNKNLSNLVTFEIFPVLKEDDFDLLILFLENKRQSDGGDISNVDKITFSCVEQGKILKISYKDFQVTQRVIARKFLKFKNYCIRTLPGSISNFKSETLDPLTNELLIQNISLNQEDDESIIEMYAEYLSSDNQVCQIVKSSLSPDTFLVVFKNEFNRENINVRFNKKSVFRNKKVSLLDAYRTKSLIIFNQKKQHTDFGTLIDEFNSESMNVKYSFDYFIECNDYSIIFQFADDELQDKFVDFFQTYLKSIESDLKIEKVVNFALVENYTQDTQDKLEEKPTLTKKFIDVGVQTDILSSQIYLKESPIDSMPSKISSSNSIKLDHEIELDSEDFCIMALINVKQLFINFDEIIKKINPKLELINSNGKLLIKNGALTENSDWKTRVMDELANFKKKIKQQIVEIPSEIFNNDNLMPKLDEKVQEINKLCPGLYFRIYNQNIEGIGYKKVLIKKLNELNNFFSSVLNNQDVQDANVGGLEIDPDSLMYESLWNIKNIFSDFKHLLKSIGADLRVVNEQKLMIFQIDNQLYSEIKLKDFLAEFEKKIKKLNLEIPEILKSKKHYDLFTNEIKKHEKLKLNEIKIELFENIIQAYGYCKRVDKFIKKMGNKFTSLQQEINKNIQNKLNIVIKKSTKIDFIILNNFNRRHFKEFSEILIQHNARLAVFKNGFKISSTMHLDDEKDERKVNKWNSVISNCKREFFFRFTRQNVQLPFGKTVPINFEYNCELVKIDWKGNSAEIIGEKNEVERIRKKLVEKDNLSITDELTSQFNVSNPDDNTFLINDLKWFQIRILFVEQYFKYLADNFKDLKVMLDTKLTRICLSGAKKDIDEAKNLAFKILNELLGVEIECGWAFLHRMQKSEASLSNFLKENNLKCVIDVNSHPDKFIVYTTKFEDIQKFKTIFSSFKF